MSANAENIKALEKPVMVKPKMLQCPKWKHSRPAFISHPKRGKQIRGYMSNGHRLCQTKPTIQTKAEAAAPAEAPQDTQAPVKVP